MRVNVRVAQLIGDGVQEQIATLVVQVHRQILQNVHVGVVDDVCHCRVLALSAVKVEF